MIDHILTRHSQAVAAAVVVVDPDSRDRVAEHLGKATRRALPVTLAVQAAPTGMLDALLAGAAAALGQHPDRVWITWCDQVGISAHTVARLEQLESASPDCAVIMPLVRQPDPYIHFDRDAHGRLAGVRHRREGDPMPDIGASDAGLFSLSYEAFALLLPEYARTAERGARTGERNFLPFLPWLAARRTVSTFEIPVDEARGINTPEDLAAVEQRLQDAPGIEQ
jgi:bifunctional UDP-N-acetylglucosamine pyrophosphorylase / glucosamine-1-phosphate N-acetyltransferase